jgi:hypothetical protein
MTLCSSGGMQSSHITLSNDIDVSLLKSDLGMACLKDSQVAISFWSVDDAAYFLDAVSKTASDSLGDS